MSVYVGPNSPTNGLVFEYDITNTQKSWKGAPTTNLWSYSRAFTNWNKTSAITITDNSALSPNNDLTASTITANGSTNSYINLTGTITSGTTYTKSIYAKAGTTPNLIFESYDNNGSGGTAFFSTSFNLSLGTYSAASGDTATITYITNGWYRCSVTRAYTLTTGAGTIYIGTYGAGTGSIYLWDAQLEVGTFSTPVVATNGTTASRSNTQALIDLTGNSTVTLTSLTYSSGSFSFNGTTDRFNLGSPANGTLDFGTGDFALESWFKLSSLPNTWTSIIHKGSAGAVGYAMDIDPSNYLNASIQGVTGVNQHSAGYLLSANVWYHSVIVFNRTLGMQFYINGVLVSTASYNSGNNSSVTSATYMFIGAASDTPVWNFPGQIPKVLIYNRTLSADEVWTNFAANRGRFGI